MRAVLITIIFLVVLFAIYLIYFLLKKQNSNNINELNERKETLIKGVPTMRLETVKNMDISGKTLKKAKELEQEWNEIHSGKNILVENKILLADEMNSRGKFSKSREYQNQALSEMDNIEIDIEKLILSLDEIINREKVNESTISDSRKKYKHIRQQLLTDTGAYAQSVESLESKLAELEENFEKYTKLTESGDHEEAKTITYEINDQLKQLSTLMEEIPGVLSTVENDFYPQIEEIEVSHEQLIRQGFVFPGTPIPKEAEDISNRVEYIQQKIGNLEIEEAKEVKAEVADNIELLYDRMETEIVAKQSVEKKLEDIRKLIYFLSEEVRVLFFEIDRVSQSYVLVNNEAEQIADLRTDVNIAEDEYEKIVDGIDSNFAIYSESEKALDELNEELEEISRDKDSVTDQLKSYKDQEMQLKNDLDAMQQTVREQKRIINSNNLPGVPSDYSEYYNHVSNALATLEDELARPKLKVEKIYDIYNRCLEDVEELEVRTNRLITYANLTEDAAQALYKYKDENPEVLQLIRQSEQMFNEVYDYEGAYSIVKDKLLRIAPEEVDKLEYTG